MSIIETDRLRDVLSTIPAGGWMSYGDVAAACGSRAGTFAGSAFYILGGAPFWITKQVFWNAPKALLKGS